MEIDEKSIVELQISMNLAQEFLSYFKLGYMDIEHQIAPPFAFKRSFGFKKKFS